MIITESYKSLNKQLHDADPDYGISGHHWRDYVREYSEFGRLSILDFGCGKCTLARSLGPAYRVTNFDPCIPGLDSTPGPHDVVVCGDVMEHVEPSLVMNVLREIRRLTKRKAFFVIGLIPAQKFLADGRNAHLSMHDQATWGKFLEEAGFTVEQQSSPKNEIAHCWLLCT